MWYVLYSSNKGDMSWRSWKSFSFPEQAADYIRQLSDNDVLDEEIIVINASLEDMVMDVASFLGQWG